MQNSPDVVQQTNRLSQDAANYLDALEVEQIINETLEYQLNPGGDYFAEGNFDLDRPRVYPPEFLAFTIGRLDGDEVLIPLPALGISSFDGNTYVIQDFTFASATTTQVSVNSLTLFSFGVPIEVLIFVLKDKSGKDKKLIGQQS